MMESPSNRQRERVLKGYREREREGAIQPVCNLWTLRNTNQLLLALDMHDVVAWQPHPYPKRGRGGCVERLDSFGILEPQLASKSCK